MAFRSEAVATFNQSVGVKQDMDEAIRILSPSDTPLQQLLPTDTTNEVKIEWMEEELMPQTVVWTSKTGTGPWTVTSPDTSELRVGDVLAVRDGTSSAVQVVVTSITNGTTFVCAGFAGNTTSPADGSTMEIVGQYLVEGSDPLAPRSTERVAKYNYTQIFQEAVQATRTARHRGARGGLFGGEDPYIHELGKKFKELGIRAERAFVHGQRAVSGDSKQRALGGLFYYITSNSTSGLKANIKTLLNDAIRKSYDAGGDENQVLMVSPTLKSIISTLNDSYVRTVRTENVAGSTVDVFMSDFGELRIIPNRHFPKTRGIVLSTSGDNSVVNFDGWTHEMLAKTGDSDKGQIVAEKSLRVKNEKGQGLFTVTDA